MSVFGFKKTVSVVFWVNFVVTFGLARRPFYIDAANPREAHVKVMQSQRRDL